MKVYKRASWMRRRYDWKQQSICVGECTLPHSLRSVVKPLLTRCICWPVADVLSGLWLLEHQLLQYSCFGHSYQLWFFTRFCFRGVRSPYGTDTFMARPIVQPVGMDRWWMMWSTTRDIYPVAADSVDAFKLQLHGFNVMWLVDKLASFNSHLLTCV